MGNILSSIKVFRINNYQRNIIFPRNVRRDKCLTNILKLKLHEKKQS